MAAKLNIAAQQALLKGCQCLFHNNLRRNPISGSKHHGKVRAEPQQ